MYSEKLVFFVSKFFFSIIITTRHSNSHKIIRSNISVSGSAINKFFAVKPGIVSVKNKYLVLCQSVPQDSKDVCGGE
jgi:hypothetical protein